MNQINANQKLLDQLIEKSSGLNKMLLTNLIDFKIGDGYGLNYIARLQSTHRHLLGAQKSVELLLKAITESDATLTISIIAAPERVDTAQALIGWGRHKPAQLKRNGRN